MKKRIRFVAPIVLWGLFAVVNYGKSCVPDSNRMVVTSAPGLIGIDKESGVALEECPAINVDSRLCSGKVFLLPASLITVGALGTAIEGMSDFHLFGRKSHVGEVTKVDDYLEWGMLGYVFAVDPFGHEKHHWSDQLAIVCLAEGINAAMVQGLKRGLNVTRPNGQDHSFPSGHTANVFLGAHVAYKEFIGKDPWLAYTGYALAMGVGALRVYKNYHWLADVVSGAGFGILSVELSYLCYFPLKEWIGKYLPAGNKNLSIVPMLGMRHQGIYLSMRF